ncbi:hypothetical protein CCW15_23625 [Salmonella enterica]|nr:hypothetical protein [Salmonella enterica]
MSVRFRDACQGGGAYGKTALPRPYRFPVKLLPGILQEISAPFVSPHRSPQPNDRAQRVSERGSGTSPALHILLTLRCCIFLLPHEALSRQPHSCQHNKPVYTPLALRDWFRAAPRNPLNPLTRLRLVQRLTAPD